MTYTFKKSCPYCGGDVVATETGWTHEADGIDTVDSIDADCTTAPIDMDSEEWDEWMRIHSNMPYVYWLPFQLRMIEAINRHWKGKNPDGTLPDFVDPNQLTLFQ